MSATIGVDLGRRRVASRPSPDPRDARHDRGISEITVRPPTASAIGRRTFLIGVAGLAVAACGSGGGGAARRHRIVERGVNYDVGTGLFGGLSRTSWTSAYVERELSAIRDELECTAVLLVGSDVDRLSEAATLAVERGLRVWLEPRPFDATPRDAIELFVTVADIAETVRAGGGDAVMSLGVEHSLFLAGLVPGDDFFERAASLAGADFDRLGRDLNAFLVDAVAAVRPAFGGSLTYSSGTWEAVDWEPFDLVGVDLYRDASNKATYRHDVRALHRHGKPVVITEFGCCCYVGADDRGGDGFNIVDWSGPEPVLTGNPVRDEQVQADYLDELLDVFEAEGVYGAFVWNFIEPDSPYSPDPRRDLDMAGFAVVRCDDDYASNRTLDAEGRVRHLGPPVPRMRKFLPTVSGRVDGDDGSAAPGGRTRASATRAALLRTRRRPRTPGR